MPPSSQSELQTETGDQKIIHIFWASLITYTTPTGVSLITEPAKDLLQEFFLLVMDRCTYFLPMNWH